MGQLDWNEVLAVDSTSLQDDEEKAERMFNILAEAGLDINSPEVNNAENVIQLFKVTQAVMLVKHMQYEAAVDELENGGEKEKDLAAEVEALQKELAHYQKFTGAGDKYLKSEMAQLEERNKLYEKELEELERKLVKEQKHNDTVSKQCEDLDIKNKELEREVDRLGRKIKDYQRQVESQRESNILRQGADMSVKDQISKKNKEISSYVDEIRELQDENDRLQKDIQLAQTELKEATDAMNTMADDYAKLKSVLEDTDFLLENMRQERELLISQVQDLGEKMQSKSDVDDEVMVAFNKRNEEWEAAFISKEEEVAQLRNVISDLQKQLQAARMDTEKNVMAELILANQEKDEKIKELKKSLEEASKEMELVTVKIEESRNKAKEGGTSFRQQAKIETLSQTLHKEQLTSLKEREQMQKLERDVAEKDKLISELRGRMMQYEMGQFGLPEAVQEIKEFRTKMKVRDKNIEDLTQNLNHVQMELDDYMIENEELRERLGMDPKEKLDSQTIRRKKQVKEEQTLALNRVLTKEVERLEEERQQLKKMLRKQAMHRGERAVELGLTTEDLEAVEETALQSEPKIRPLNTKSVYAETLSSKPQTVDEDQVEKVKDRMKMQMNKLEKSNAELKEENKHLEIGLREILAMIKDNRLKEENQGQVELSIPALEKLIAMIESRNAEGNYDTNIKLKTELDQLNGRNDELRLELKRSRNEVHDLLLQVERKQNQVEELEKEVEVLKDTDRGVIKLNPFQLSEGMTPASRDIIASLNEYLIQILQELSNREEALKQMEESLESFKRKYSVAMHQQSLLYSQFLDEKEQNEVEFKQLKEENRRQTLLREQDEVKLQEFDRMLETLNRSPEKQKARIAEYARKLTVLRVNEKSLVRRYTLLSESEEQVRKECNKLKDEVTSVETAVSERIGFLTRYKEMAAFRIAALQKALDESVPEIELQILNKKYNELTSKYRDLLQKENTLISKSTAVNNLEFELKRHQETEVSLKKELQNEKEKSFSLEQSMNALVKKVGSHHSSLGQEEVTSIARQLATLEMKELNERQRAEHAVRRQEQMKLMVSDLENRNNELEQKFAELTKINFESQRVERELREELCNAVPAEINRADKKQIKELEEKEANLKLESSRLKEVAEIATHQAESISFRQQVQEKELTSLRRQLHDIQMETDEKTIIAKLHQQIVAQQVSEAAAVRKLEVTNSKVKKLQVAVLRIEQQLDEKDQMLYRVRIEARAKARFLQKTVQDLRRQFSGSLPLIKQETYARTLRELQNSRAQQDIDFNQAMTKRKEAEDRSTELELKLVGLQELLVTLKDVKGAEKVTEWHNRMGEVRLQDMRLRRQIENQEQRIKYLEDQNKRLEDSISLLEDENCQQSKEYEDRQLVWEQYEVELERKIARLEKNQDELFEAAQKFEDATGSYVDPNLPVASQLEMAIVKLKEHIKTIIITRAQNKQMKEEIGSSQKSRQEAERKLANKDKLINELRLRLPISERPVIKEQGGGGSEVSPEQQHAENALQIAQSTVNSLKIMVKKKEETISKYQEMLKALRNDIKALEESHKDEMKIMQDRLHLEMEEKVKKLRAMHLDYINSPQPPVPSEKQLNRLADLEEIVAEQDNKLAVSQENVNKMKKEMEKLKEAKEIELKMQKKKLRLREEEHQAEIEKLKKEIEDGQMRVTELNKEVEMLRDDLLAAKEANERAPTKTMKTVIERLRNQLALKEKQQKALSQALLKLRADMVYQAEDDVKSNAKKAEEELNIQKIVDKQTSVLEAKIEELEEKQIKLREELKIKRNEADATRKELESFKRENQRKEAGVKKLAAELKEREELDDEIEDLRAKVKSLEKFKTEAEKLRRRLEVAEEEHKIGAVQAEPVLTSANMDVDQIEEQSKEQTSRSEVIKWEEGKKWQKRVDTLKAKLKEKTEEVEKLEKSNQMLKEIIQRNEKEKSSLQSKIKSIARPEEFQLASMTSKEGITHSLKSRIFQLEEENNDLQRRLAMDKDVELHELRIKNSQLMETAKALEKELARQQMENQPDEFSWSLAREQALQKEILEIRKESMELKFENERARANIPRLQGRVKDLEEYCEIIKAELEALKNKEKQRKGTMGTGIGGQSVEDMERVIAAMRRVIERLQGENDTLKKQSSKNISSSEMSRENRQLKQEIQKLKSRDSGSLSARGSTITKINNENEKIRKELKKSMGEVEKLQTDKSNLHLEKEKLARELEEAKKQLSSAEARVPKLSEADSKQWNSVLMTQMSEERVAQAETELKKKSELLGVMKNELKCAIERETELMRKEDEYKSKISLLERFPNDIKVDSDVVQHLQRARLRINTLEAEKNELLDDVSRLQQLTNDGKTAVKFDEDEMLLKLKKYDKLLAVEVELRTELRASKSEKERLVSENLKLKKELDAFDPSFFEELEDLKYNYKKSVERNVLYERQLQQLSKQFGIEVRIDNTDYY